MAGITLAEAEAKLSVWMDAEETLAVSQSYEIQTPQGSRKLTRANLKEVADRIKFWEDKVRKLNRATKKAGKYGVPV